MARRITDIVNEGEVLGVVSGQAASVALADDQTAAQVPFTPAGDLVATDVQAALVELDTEKLSSVGISDIDATGTPSSTTYLRGDGSWSTPSGGGGGGIVSAYGRAYKASGAISFSSTAWADFDTATDITIPAATGDRIEVSVCGRWNSEAEWGVLDVATIVSTAVVNTFSTQGAESSSSTGIPSWMGPPSRDAPFGGSASYVLQAGDISGGNVKLRLRRRTLSAATKSMFISGTGFWWSATNFGS